METLREGKMKRGVFLRSLGLSSSALMAFYCLGTTSCGSKDDNNPTPNPETGDGVTGTTTGNAINFTLDLKNNNFSKLKTAGESLTVGDVFLASTTSNGIIAVVKNCTHEGNLVTYRSQQNDIFCPAHLSEFSLTGTVEQGPATTPLKTYKTSLSTDGNTLTVTA